MSRRNKRILIAIVIALVIFGIGFLVYNVFRDKNNLSVDERNT